MSDEFYVENIKNLIRFWTGVLQSGSRKSAFCPLLQFVAEYRRQVEKVGHKASIDDTTGKEEEVFTNNMTLGTVAKAFVSFHTRLVRDLIRL